jgi:hypothetical protein
MSPHAHAQSSVAALDKAIEKEGVSVMSPGQISQSIARELAEKIPPDMIATGIKELIAAKRTNKRGEEEVDVRAKEAGLKLALAYRVGLPVQRVESINVNLDPDSQVGIEERLANSPALRQALRKTLDRCDGVASVEQ